MEHLSGFTTRKQLGLRVFDDTQCAVIHRAVIEVLAETGVEVHSNRALTLLRKAGAHVNGTRVRFPACFLESALKSAPSTATIYARDMSSKMTLGGDQFYFGPGPTLVYTEDPITKERRFPTYEDECKAVKVMDALKNIDYLMDFGTISNVEKEFLDVWAFKAMYENSAKPILHWAYTVENLQAMIDIGTTIRGSLEEFLLYPFFGIYVEPITPLKHEQNALEICMTMSEYGLPVVYTPGVQGGMTAPVTLAGALVVQLCDSLSGLIIHQLTHEGSPFIMGGVNSSSDLSSLQYTFGSPEFNLQNLAACNMAHYYNIPVFTSGGCTDSKCVDQQAGADMATNVLIAALGGGNLIHDVGYMESAMMSSVTAMVIADELIGQAKHIIRGIEISEETLALDLIKHIGPGGNYIGEEHTFQHFRKEWYLPEIHNRQRHANWQDDGSPTMGDLADRKIARILAEHTPNYLQADIVTACDDIIQKLSKNKK